MKKFCAYLLSAAFMLHNVAPVFASETDAYALTDEVRNIYTGSLEAVIMSENLNFSDVPLNHWAREPIIRGGALNLIKGDNKNFDPSGYVSNQDAIAFALRLAGLEQQAIAIGNSLASTFPEDTPLSFIWSTGYLSLAVAAGMITDADYYDAISATETLDPEINFMRFAPATREQVAQWLYHVLSTIQGGGFQRADSVQAIHTFNDWESISPDKSAAVEAIALNGVMGADLLGNFNPKNNITRAEMAQILKNLERVYLPVFGLQKKNGTVAAIKDRQSTTTGSAALWRDVYIRTPEGQIEVITYEWASDSQNQADIKDAVVYKNGLATSLASLAEGDALEYIVNPAENRALYIQVIKSAEVSEIKGLLNQVNADSKTIVLTDATGKKYSYTVAEQLFQPSDGVSSLLMDGKRQAVASLPYGAAISITLTGGIVTQINYIGNPTIVNEIKGVVIENDPAFGTITLLDNNGSIIVKNYYENEMKVTKEQYYDLGDDLGYITEIFPHFEFDKRETSIWEIEAGDIVFLRFDPDEPDVITSISAATNYTMRYGKIRQVTDNGDYSSILIEYENKQTAWFDFSNNIFATKSGRPVPVTTLIAGDWVKLLVNEAIISAGYVMETIKELCIEGQGHLITTIVKGSLSSLDAIQNQITIKDAQELTKTGWSNYKNLSKFSIAAKDIEYYNNSTRISLDYAMKYFKRSNAVVYIALQNGLSGLTVKKVAFRAERDELLNPDTVLHADGNGSFGVLGVPGDVLTDDGTIVIRHGRLVDGKDVMPSDYVRVSLNGENRAAVIEVTDMPSVSEIQIAFGRVLSVDENNSFKVSSTRLLSGMHWIYTPVQREFTIDYNTKFISENGLSTMDNFIGYTPDSVINKQFNIVVDGSRAAYVIDSPYCADAVRGVIYSNDGTTLMLKDVSYYEKSTGKWLKISDVDNTLAIATAQNTIFGKDNSLTIISSLVEGDQVIAYTNELPEFMVSGAQINGYMVFVEK